MVSLLFFFRTRTEGKNSVGNIESRRVRVVTTGNLICGEPSNRGLLGKEADKCKFSRAELWWMVNLSHRKFLFAGYSKSKKAVE